MCCVPVPMAKQLNTDLAIIDKRRPKANVAEVMHIIGDVSGRTCLIMDDMVDTANTLCKAAQALKAHGAERVSWRMRPTRCCPGLLLNASRHLSWTSWWLPIPFRCRTKRVPVTASGGGIASLLGRNHAPISNENRSALCLSIDFFCAAARRRFCNGVSGRGCVILR